MDFKKLCFQTGIADYFNGKSSKRCPNWMDKTERDNWVKGWNYANKLTYISY